MITPIPYSKIAVGVDFSNHSDIAVRRALALARHQGASLVLVHIATPPEALVPIEGAEFPVSRIDAAERRARYHRQLVDMRDRLTGQGVDVSQAIVEGYADQALATTAAELGADLIVVGSHGFTGLKRVLMGSVAEKTVRFAEQSVLVVRGEQPASGYDRIVIGTDFTSHADRAMARALAIASPDAELHVVACWQPHAPAFGVDPIALGADAAASLARRTQEMIGDARANRHDVVEATPLAGLEAAAEHDRADLVVVGSHGRRGIRRMVLGSVAEAVVRHAACSVLVAR
jgi:nucleotide-binding universal stress UspA family protein